MFGKLFASMYDGSLRTRNPWQALVAFQQLIVLANKEGEVDMTSEALSLRTGIPLEIIALGIRSLEQPDPDSRTPGEEGRRIVRLDPERSWGWRIVNYEHYRKIRSADERREYMRLHMRDKRAKARKKVSVVNSPLASVSNVSQGSKQYAVSSKQLTTQTDAASPLFVSAWQIYPTRDGSNPRRAAEKAWHARQASGTAEADMVAGVERYRAYCDAKGLTGTSYVMQAARFFGPNCEFNNAWAVVLASPVVLPDRPEHWKDRNDRKEREATENGDWRHLTMLVETRRAHSVDGVAWWARMHDESGLTGADLYRYAAKHLEDGPYAPA